MYAKYVKLRDEKGLTDADISKITDIPRSTFTDWKSGRSNPKIEKLVKIAAALDVTLDDFVRSES